jgi:myosin-light-chain kinase
LLFYRLSGLSPFVGENDITTMGNVSNGLYSFDHRSFEPVSDNAKDFISQLLIKDGAKRMSSMQALNHPWLIEKALNTELSITKTKLKRYVIKKRWIKAVNTIIALRRMGARIDFSLV